MTLARNNPSPYPRLEGSTFKTSRQIAGDVLSRLIPGVVVIVDDRTFAARGLFLREILFVVALGEVIAKSPFIWAKFDRISTASQRPRSDGAARTAHDQSGVCRAAGLTVDVLRVAGQGLRPPLPETPERRDPYSSG
jgi:hypothetical protein